MKKRIVPVVLVILLSFSLSVAKAQCSICTKGAQQLGEKPAKALNVGIIYLGFMPLAILGFIGFQWWKNNSQTD